VQDGEDGEDGNEDGDKERTKKEPKKSYEKSRKFQLSWVAKCPWAEAVVDEKSGLTMVKCLTCEAMTRKPVILALKIETLQRHQGKRITIKNMSRGVKKGDKYITKTCMHLKNERTLASTAARPIDEAVQVVSGERARKRLQMGVIFHLLKQGCPMLEYATNQPLLQFLNVPKLARRHWSDGAGWVLVECLFE
jgi:hypothetical protein